jgi:small-conductance mechanosensitive channel
VAVLVGRWIVSLVLDRVIRRFVKRTQTLLDDAILSILRGPLYLFVVVFAFQISVNRLDFLPTKWEGGKNDLIFVLYLLVGYVFIWQLVTNLFEWYGREMALRTETDLDEQLMPFFRRVALIILSLIWMITLLGRFDVDISAMVTTLGIGSLAIALAAQAVLGDTISGFAIMVDRPFRIGDRIEIQDLDTWGDVIDIGLRSSRIRTRDNRMVIVPNSVIGKSLVVNYSFPDTQYRIQVHIGIAYGSDIELARKTMIDAIHRVEGVLTERPIEALFLEFGDSALIFRVRWWLESYIDTRRMFDRVNTALLEALEGVGIEIPIPQQEIHHKMNPVELASLAEMLKER